MANWRNSSNRYEFGVRWLLTGCAFLGWALGIASAFEDSITSGLFAFLAGRVLIPRCPRGGARREGPRFWWFGGGSAAYATILMRI